MKQNFQLSSEHDFGDERIIVKNVGACPGGDAFLLLTKQKAALIDSGYACCAEQMIENVKRALGGRSLDFILLTHSHYDHASGSAYCRPHFQNVKVLASAYASKIFSRPSALAVMRTMNQNAARLYHLENYEDKLDELRVDRIVGEGDVIDLGDVFLRVMDAPGHTKCSIAFYIPREKMLISCETMGVCGGKRMVAPAFLVGYEMSMNFIRRALGMEIEKLLVPHYGVLTGQACRDFLNDALRCSRQLKELIVEDDRQGKTQEEIIEHYRNVFYTPECQASQPLEAFNLNASYLVPMVLKETRR